MRRAANENGVSSWSSDVCASDLMPPTAVVRGDRARAGLAGHLCDLRGVLAHLVPGLRWTVGIEARLLEQISVVDEAEGVALLGDAVDRPVSLQELHDTRVEVIEAVQLRCHIRDVGHLAALDERRRLGERNAQEDRKSTRLNSSH